jgi:hypothetical protein
MKKQTLWPLLIYIGACAPNPKEGEGRVQTGVIAQKDDIVGKNQNPDSGEGLQLVADHPNHRGTCPPPWQPYTHMGNENFTTTKPVGSRCVYQGAAWLQATVPKAQEDMENYLKNHDHDQDLNPASYLPICNNLKGSDPELWKEVDGICTYTRMVEKQDPNAKDIRNQTMMDLCGVTKTSDLKYCQFTVNKSLATPSDTNTIRFMIPSENQDGCAPLPGATFLNGYCIIPFDYLTGRSFYTKADTDEQLKLRRDKALSALCKDLGLHSNGAKEDFFKLSNIQCVLGDKTLKEDGTGYLFPHTYRKHVDACDPLWTEGKEWTDRTGQKTKVLSKTYYQDKNLCQVKLAYYPRVPDTVVFPPREITRTIFLPKEAIIKAPFSVKFQNITWESRRPSTDEERDVMPITFFLGKDYRLTPVFSKCPLEMTKCSLGDRLNGPADLQISSAPPRIQSWSSDVTFGLDEAGQLLLNGNPFSEGAPPIPSPETGFVFEYKMHFNYAIPDDELGFKDFTITVPQPGRIIYFRPGPNDRGGRPVIEIDFQIPPAP